MSTPAKKHLMFDAVSVPAPPKKTAPPAYKETDSPFALPTAVIPNAQFVADYCDQCRGRFEYKLPVYNTPLGERQLCGKCAGK